MINHPFANLFCQKTISMHQFGHLDVKTLFFQAQPKNRKRYAFLTSLLVGNNIIIIDTATLVKNLFRRLFVVTLVKDTDNQKLKKIIVQKERYVDFIMKPVIHFIGRLKV